MAEVSLNEAETPEVVQHCDSRSLPSRLQPDGLERHRVVNWQNCDFLFQNVPDTVFSRGMLVFFIVLLGYTIINLIIAESLLTRGMISWNFITDQTWPYGLGRKGTMLLAMFAVGVVVGVFTKKMKKTNATASTPQAFVQKV